MTTYIIFKPDSHYAYPKGIRSSNFMMPYEREMLLKLYEESDYNSFTMGDYETIEEAFDDYGWWPSMTGARRGKSYQSPGVASVYESIRRSLLHRV